MNGIRAVLLVLFAADRISFATPMSYAVPSGGSAHILTLRYAGDQFQLLDGGALMEAQPIASVSTILVRGQPDQNDTLRLDFASGLRAPPGGITFEGGSRGWDTLEAIGGRWNSITFRHATADSGSIVYDDGLAPPTTVHFSGLEPISNTGTAQNMVFELPAGSDVATLASSGTAGSSTLSSNPVTFESTTFTNPTGSLTIHAGDGNDLLTLAALDPNYPSLTLDGQGGDDGLVFGAALQLAPGASLTGTAETIAVHKNISATGIGAISLTAPRSILLSQAAVSAIDGNISFSANQGAPALSGAFVGIDLNDASSVTTGGTGDILLAGRGGSDAGTSDQAGVRIWSGCSVRSTSPAAGAGSITITGTGGSGIDRNAGVILLGDGLVTSGFGPIHVTGQGGAGSGRENAGVVVGISGSSSNGQITSTGTGPGAATILVEGTGGAGSLLQHGVWLGGTASRIASVDGDIQLTGQGGTGSGNAEGVVIQDGASATSSGSTAEAARINIEGKGGTASEGPNHGFELGSFVQGLSPVVSSVVGDIQITGTGGVDPNDQGAGIVLAGSARLASTGAALPAAAIDLEGTSGWGPGAMGIYLAGGVLTSVLGPIQATGAGPGGAALGGRGIELANIQLSSTGTGASAATITLEGTSPASSEGSAGISADSNGSIHSVDGAVELRGTSLGAGENSDGIRVFNPFQINITGDADFKLQGLASTQSGASGYGILLDSGITVSGEGDVLFDGTGHEHADVQWSSVHLGKSGGSFTVLGLYDGSAFTADAGAYSVDLPGGGTMNGATVFNNTGGVSFGSTGVETTIFTGALTSTASPTSLAGMLQGFGISLGALTLTAGATLDLQNITDSTIGSIAGAAHDLTIQGSGTLRVNGSVQNLGDGTGPALTIGPGSLAKVSFGGILGANSGLLSSSVTTTARFEGDVTLANGDTGTSLGQVELDGLSFSGEDGLSFGNTTLSGAPVTVTATDNTAIAFTGFLDGPEPLTLNTAGITTLSAVIGSTIPLGPLTTDAGGSVILEGGPITTSGAQTYNDPASLTASLTSNGYDVSFGGNVTLGALGRIDAGVGAIHFAQSLDLGSGMLTLIAGAATVLGPSTTLESGGVLKAEPGVVVPSGGSLSGVGSVEASLTVLSGGTLAPGTVGIGILHTGNLDLRSGSTLALDVGGTGADESDQIIIDPNSSVTLAGSLAVTLGSYTPAAGDSLTVILNLGSSPISGTFAGLPEGSMIQGAQGLRITYGAGTGNDVNLFVPTTIDAWPSGRSFGWPFQLLELPALLGMLAWLAFLRRRRPLPNQLGHRDPLKKNGCVLFNPGLLWNLACSVPLWDVAERPIFRCWFWRGAYLMQTADPSFCPRALNESPSVPE